MNKQDKPKEITVKDLPKCEYCGKPFIPTGPRQKYCSNNCKQAAFQEAKRKEAR